MTHCGKPIIANGYAREVLGVTPATSWWAPRRWP